MGVEAYRHLAMKPEPVARFHPLIDGNNARRGLSVNAHRHDLSTAVAEARVAAAANRAVEAAIAASARGMGAGRRNARGYVQLPSLAA